MKSIVFFTLILSAVLLAGSHDEATPVDLKILTYTFNLELEEAFNLTSEQIKKSEASPKYYFYYVNVMMMDYGVKINQGNRELREKTKEKLLASIVEYCEMVDDKFEDAELSTEDKFYFAGVLGYLARVYGIDRSWWAAFQAGQDAQSLMEEVLEEDPEYYDAYLMLGMFEYFADRMSGVTSLIASILGFSGDRDTGLEYINLAYDRGSYATFGQTSLMLIEILTRMEENKFSSVPYFENFLEKYPKNYRVKNWFGRELLTTWNYTLAKKLIENDSQNIVDASVKADYYSGIGNSLKAIEYCKIAFENSETQYSWTSRNIGWIYTFNNWLLGNLDEVEKKKAELGERQTKMLIEIIDYPEESKWLAQFGSAIARNEPHTDIERFINNAPEFKLAKNDQTRVYYSGIYHFGIGEYGEAESYFTEAKSSDDPEIKYNAFKYLVEIYIKTPVDTNKVELLIEEVEELESERLSFRVKELEAAYKLD
jgi:tetratricopeptide (TPR) repeat protein